MIEPYAVIVGVEVYIKWQLLDSIAPGWMEMSYDHNQSEVEWWCENNGAHHYEASREDFSMHIAAMQAIDRGLSRVVVNDLS